MTKKMPFTSIPIRRRTLQQLKSIVTNDGYESYDALIKYLIENY